jgi:hypothetical protein
MCGRIGDGLALELRTEGLSFDGMAKSGANGTRAVMAK